MNAGTFAIVLHYSPQFEMSMWADDMKLRCVLSQLSTTAYR